MCEKSDWYENTEEPIRNLVKLLRDNGFNTSCSCGHLPRPYVQIEWYEDSEITSLCDLLLENNYHDFKIEAIWEPYINKRFLDLSFSIKMPLAEESDIRKDNREEKMIPWYWGIPIGAMGGFCVLLLWSCFDWLVAKLSFRK